MAAFAHGGTFGCSGGGCGVQRFAAGDVFSDPTMFLMRDGRPGVLGEAGPEAIMPLERGPGGKLGVRASGGGSTTVNQKIIIYANESIDGARRSRRQVGSMLRKAAQG